MTVIFGDPLLVCNVQCLKLVYVCYYYDLSHLPNPHFYIEDLDLVDQMFSCSGKQEYEKVPSKIVQKVTDTGYISTSKIEFTKEVEVKPSKNTLGLRPLRKRLFDTDTDCKDEDKEKGQDDLGTPLNRKHSNLFQLIDLPLEPLTKTEGEPEDTMTIIYPSVRKECFVLVLRIKISPPSPNRGVR